MFSALHAGVYKLNDGQTLSGDPISFNETGLIVRQNDGAVSSRTPWSQFSQDSLKQILADAKNPKDKAFVEPLIEETIEKETKRKEIAIKPVEAPARPTGSLGIFAGFSSPLFLVIFAVIYFANIYAAFEIAFFKNLTPAVVCGVAAVLPIIGPIIYLCLPGHPDPMQGELYAPTKPPEALVEEATVPLPTGEVSAAPLAGAPGDSNPLVPQPGSQGASRLKIAHEEPAAAPIPAPVVFSKGEFSFNRRFFETKLAGFFRVVPSEAEKDMVIGIKSLRGDFVGKRISRVTQTELFLQVFKDNATHDEMIPFTEVQEVSIQHKNA
ncbi:MAG: hypothetical protein ABIQ35_01755 [Verrucomicrobiota bacterium]